MDINSLQTISNFAKDKGITRQHAYRLEDSGDITLVKIDGVAFVVLDEKAKNFTRKRKEKKPKKS